MSTDPLLWRRLAESLLLPPGGPLMLAICGTLLWRRGGRWLLGAGLLAGWVTSTTAFAGLLLAPLESRYPGLAAPPPQAQAIVVLGGGVQWGADWTGQPLRETVGGVTLERLREAARLAHLRVLPVWTSGGIGTNHKRAEAAWMRESLQDDFRVADVQAEPDSLDTQANAVRTAERLRAAGVTRIVLVTSAAHMPRATWLFRREGLDVTPAPAPPWAGIGWQVADFTPSGRGVARSQAALHEWAGLTLEMLKVRVDAMLASSPGGAAGKAP